MIVAKVGDGAADEARAAGGPGDAGHADAVELIEQGRIQLVVNTPRVAGRGRTGPTSAGRPRPTACRA